MVRISQNICLMMVVLLLTQIRVSAFFVVQTNDKDEKRRVYDTEKKFSIIPPPGWDADGQAKSPSTILSRKGGEKEQFSNFIVKKRPVPQGAKFIEYAKGVIDGTGKLLEDFEMLEDGEMKIDGRETYYAYFKATGNNVKVIAGFYLIKADGDELYSMNYTVLPPNFERLKPELKKAAATIRIARL